MIITLAYLMSWVLALTEWAPEGLSITWSLAVEEQCYLFWPLAFLLVRKWPRLPVIVAVLGVLIAPTLRLLLWQDGGPVGSRRIYYGTDTHMDALLLGCLLAYWVRSGRSLPRWLALPAMGGLVFAVATTYMGSTAIGLVLPLVVPVATCALICYCLHASNGFFASRPMRWLGQRSYGLHLWHYPLLTMVAPAYEIPRLVLLPVSLVIAELSYRFIEQPFLRRRQGVGSSSELDVAAR